MRVLVVTDEHPWPARTGYRLRLAEVLRTLATTCTVDLIAVDFDPAAAGDGAPDDTPLARHVTVPSGVLPAGRARRLVRWAATDLPRDLLVREWSRPRAVLADWLSTSSYDVVWFSHAATFVALGDLVRCPVVVDLDNLDAAVVMARRRLLTSRLRAAACRVDERRWLRVQSRVTDGVDVVVVCSDLDRHRVGGRAEVVVLPNGYERAVERISPQRPAAIAKEGPVLLMVGLLTYGPNVDAAEFFSTSVLPALRDAVPGVVFRLVGRYRDTAETGALRARPGVRLVGEVVDVTPELEAADVVVVPIRYGGGTRIKILEAFAHGVPVVTTAAGCEGLDVVDGEHLLIVDDPLDFAAACIRLLADASLRMRIIANAQDLWSTTYRWESVRHNVMVAVERAVDR
jgi:glycosyltransferase involved in cell wall biosynthesis